MAGQPWARRGWRRPPGPRTRRRRRGRVEQQRGRSASGCVGRLVVVVVWRRRRGSHRRQRLGRQGSRRRQRPRTRCCHRSRRERGGLLYEWREEVARLARTRLFFDRGPPNALSLCFAPPLVHAGAPLDPGVAAARTKTRWAAAGLAGGVGGEDDDDGASEEERCQNGIVCVARRDLSLSQRGACADGGWGVVGRVERA